MSDSFEDKINKTDTCWLWTAALFSNGYGAYLHTSAHRYSYERYKGHIPDNLYVLHRCDIKHCVNPEHLYLGTPKDNMADFMIRGRHFNASKTQCPRGHEYTKDNTYIHRGQRRCKKCTLLSNTIGRLL